MKQQQPSSSSTAAAAAASCPSESRAGCCVVSPLPSVCVLEREWVVETLLCKLPERDKKKERDRGTPTDWSLYRNGAVIGARVGDRGDSRVGDRGDATLPPR